MCSKTRPNGEALEYLCKQSVVMVQNDVRQAFQPDFLAGAVSLQRLTYVKQYYYPIGTSSL